MEKRSFIGDQNQTNPNQSLLNLKKQELSSLENKLQEKQLKTEQQSEGSFEKPKVLQKDNRNKLILGVGMGILGLGLIGLVVCLVKRKKE